MSARPALFAGALLGLSSFLLFQVEPLIGRYLLPWFGGAPAVWNSCLVFFQVALVGSYAWAHVLQRWPRRRQATLQCALLLGSVLWLAASARLWGVPLLPGLALRPPAAGSPALQMLALLCVGVGVPFFALGTTGPLVQAWLAARTGPATYRLYAASNAGAFLALLSYPLAFERLFPLSTQAWIWSGLYLAFGAACAAFAWGAGETAPAAPAPRLSGGRVSWLALPAVGSILLLSTTTQITQHVAPLPLLWVATLALYLLSLILCFEREAWYRRGVWIPLWTAALLGLALAKHLEGPFGGPLAQLIAHALVLFTGCMVAHGEMARRRPPPEALTVFYLWTAAGSALGGLCVALVAPALFSDYAEFPVALTAVSAIALFAVFGGAGRALVSGGRRAARLGWALGLVVLLEAAASEGRSEPGLRQLRSSRNFFGVLQVLESGSAGAGDHLFALLCGQIVHGTELTGAGLAHTPTSYYTGPSGIGLALAEVHRRLGAGRSLGVLGLGAGAIAAQSWPGDRLRFYEINPEIERLALGAGGYFHFLDGLAPPAEIVLGDARLSLEHEPAPVRGEGFDLLAIDAFSGDSVPVHLLTAEAMAGYLRALRPGGVLAFNVTNRHLDLSRVVRGLAARFQLGFAIVESAGAGPSPLRSRWMLLSTDPTFVSEPAIAAAAEAPDLLPAVLWTDQRVDLLPVLRFGP